MHVGDLIIYSDDKKTVLPYICQDSSVEEHITSLFAAVKVLNEEHFQDETVRERFVREAQMIDQLDHPNIVKVIRRWQSKENMFIAMELLDGKTLEHLIKQPQRITVPNALDIFCQICEAVAEIHGKKIVHRDLKPGNIMVIQKKDRPNFIKLLDFGLAKPVDQTRLTQTGVLIGTISYMAPEQLAGGNFSFTTDIYSMGVMFREVLTGEKTISVDNSIEVFRQLLELSQVEPIKNRDDIPDELNRFLVRMMAKDPRERPVAKRVLEILKKIKTEEPETQFARL